MSGDRLIWGSWTGPNRTPELVVPGVPQTRDQTGRQSGDLSHAHGQQIPVAGRGAAKDQPRSPHQVAERAPEDERIAAA